MSDDNKGWLKYLSYKKLRKKGIYNFKAAEVVCFISKQNIAAIAKVNLIQ